MLARGFEAWPGLLTPYRGLQTLRPKSDFLKAHTSSGRIVDGGVVGGGGGGARGPGRLLPLAVGKIGTGAWLQGSGFVGPRFLGIEVRCVHLFSCSCQVFPR